MTDVASGAADPFLRIGGKRFAMVIGGALVLMALAVADLATGPANIALPDLWSALIAGPGASDRTAIILWKIRMPQTLTAGLVGLSLGTAGLMMQTILANPLASPYTLGFSAAAGFGAAMVLLFGAAVPVAAWVLMPTAAFLSTLVAAGLIYGVSRLRKGGSETLVLTGIAVLFFFQALQSMLQYIASPEVLQQIVYWLFGSLAKASWKSTCVIAIVLAVVFPLIMRDAWKLTILRLGDANARSLDVDVNALRARSLVHVALLTGAAVAFTGTIGFVGLIAPHLSRALIGEDHRFSLPMSALAGASVLIVASVIGKTIAPGTIIPVGIITAIAGVPILILIVLTRPAT